MRDLAAAAKKEIIDSVLLSYGVPFGVAEDFSVELLRWPASRYANGSTHRNGVANESHCSFDRETATFERPSKRAENLRAVEVNISPLFLVTGNNFQDFRLAGRFDAVS